MIQLTKDNFNEILSLEHGTKIKVYTNDNKKIEGAISVNLFGKIYICTNSSIFNGINTEDKLGHEYSRVINHVDDMVRIKYIEVLDTRKKNIKSTKHKKYNRNLIYI